MKKRRNHFLPEFVYGGTDGAITTFAVVSGVIGASLSSSIVLILGFANLIADGFSMAVSNYLSTKSRNDILKCKANASQTAVATFFSFIIIGIIPLISFVIAAITKNDYLIRMQFTYSIFLTGIAMLIIGAIKGNVTKKSKIKSAIQTFLIGGTAAILAFVVGYFLRNLG
jgi:VIT1/CCC1 family predicted Fe2+/Mn2+ transporter